MVTVSSLSVLVSIKWLSVMRSQICDRARKMQMGDATITVTSHGAAISNNGPTRVSLFPFPPHHDSAGDVCKYLRYPCACFGRGKKYLTSAARTGCDNVRRLLAYRPGVTEGAIDVGAVEVDIVDADSE
jgi:hypothetical protein